MLNQDKIHLATLTSSFTDINFDDVILEIYHKSHNG